MILIDTSVWIDHFRRADRRLVELLDGEEALTHPFVVGELACGNLRNRREILDLFGHLPPAPCATNDEVLRFIENHSLMGCGLGYIDMHLLASAALYGTAGFWTRDLRLADVAAKLGLLFE